MHRDNELSEEEREFERAVEKAFKQGKIPAECIISVPISDDLAVKTVQYIEC